MPGGSPAFHLINPRGVGHQPFGGGIAGMVGNRPCIEIRHPSGQHVPGRLIVLDPGLRHQFGRGNTGLVDIAVPQGLGQRQAFIRRDFLSPDLGQIVNSRHPDTQIGPVNLVIAGHFNGLHRVGQRSQFGESVVIFHSTVTDLARLRGWSTSVPLATAV